MRGKDIIFNCGEFAEKLIIILFNLFFIPKSLNPVSQDKIISEMFDYFDKTKLKYFRKRIRETLKKFEKEGLLLIDKSKTGEFIIKFTKKGILFAKLKKITREFKNYKKIDKNKKRIVFFDIPEKLKKKRNALRNFLKLMGYKEIQKSVFETDYENLDDLKIIITGFGLEDYVKTGIFEEQKIKNPLN